MNRRYLFSLLVVVTLVASCDDPTEPEAPVDSADILLSPEPGRFQLEPFVWTQFSVVHRLRSELTVTFRLDGEVVSEKSTFAWTTPLPGTYKVSVDARSADGQARKATWTVDIVDEVSTPVPKVTIAEVLRAPDAGSVVIEFERPPASQTQVPVKDFLVHIRSSPFYAEGAPDIEVRELPLDSSVVLQRAELRALEPGIVAWTRVQVRDLMDRVSELGPLRGGYVTSNFTLSGEIVQFQPETLSWSPANGLLLQWRTASTSTAADGRFSLGELSDFYQEPLRISDPKSELRSMITLPKGGDDDALNLCALPLRYYSMQIDASPAQQVDLSSVLRIFTRSATVATHRPKPRYRWESYPVRVYAPDISHQGTSGELVEYRPLIEEAIATWNSVASIPLFVLEPDRAAAQVDFAVDLTPTSGLLGQASIVEPPGGSLDQEPPQKMLIRLREFNEIALARQIIRHELGHTLCMGHSPDPSHLMFETVNVDAPTTMEGEIATYIAVLPQGIDMNLYRDE